MEVTYYHFCQILLVTQTNPAAMARELHKNVNTRRWESLGAIFYSKRNYKTRSLQRGLAAIFVLSTFAAFSFRKPLSFVLALSFHCSSFQNYQKIHTYIYSPKMYSLHYNVSAPCFLSVSTIMYRSPKSNTQRSSSPHFTDSLSFII